MRTIQSSPLLTLALAPLAIAAIAAISPSQGTSDAHPGMRVGEVRSYRYASPVQSRVADPVGTVLVDEHVVRVPGAGFLALDFDRLVLRHGSILQIEGLQDSSKQRFTHAFSQKQSAYFNGDALRIRLFAGPNTSGNHFSIHEIQVGTQALAQPLTLCTPDDRTPSTDKRVARVLARDTVGVYVYTGFLISRWHCLATTGFALHNVRSVTAQFNVPPSSILGGIAQPDAKDQYLWTGTRGYQNGANGDNWGVFTVQRNATSKLYPTEAQNAGFYLMNAGAMGTATLRVTGHGKDGGRRNHVQQSVVGTRKFLTTTTLRYQVDVEAGSQGSPVIGSQGQVHAVHFQSVCALNEQWGTRATQATFKQWRNQLCQAPQDPDLVAELVSINAVTVVADGGYTVSSRIRNSGRVRSGAVSSGYYLSLNSTITTADTLIAPFTTRTLAALEAHVHSMSVRMPRTLADGSCYLGVIADRNGSLNESAENNNIRASNALSCRGLPDLAISSLTTSTTQLRPGRTVNMVCTYRNAGLGSAGACRLGFYLSNDASITNADVLLGTLSLAATNRNTTRRVNRTSTLPNNLTPGTCYLGVWVDDLRALRELSETNNTRSTPVTCFGPDRPNLTAEAVTPNTNAWRANATVSVGSRVRNTGRLASPVSTAGYYLSTDNVITTQDTLLRSFDLPSLVPQASVSPAYSVTIPANVRPGTCWIGVFADRTGAIVEESEADNTKVVAGTCIGKADLQISEFTTSSSRLTGGSGVLLRVQTKNIGTAQSAASTTAIVLSKDATISTRDELVGSYRVGPLAVDATQTAGVLARMPYCLPNGVYWLGGVADALNEIDELSTTNNTASLSRPANAYSGSGRYLEWLEPRIGVPFGAQSPSIATFKNTVGGQAGMCLTAPQDKGKLYLCIWSGSDAPFRFDAFSDFSLQLVNSPVLPLWLGFVDANGYAKPSIALPAVASDVSFTAWTHTLFFNGTNFDGFGNNTIRTILTR